jgi:hypothetical protein
MVMVMVTKLLILIRVLVGRVTFGINVLRSISSARIVGSDAREALWVIHARRTLRFPTKAPRYRATA